MQIQRLLQIALVSGVALVGLPALARGFNPEALPSSAGPSPLRSTPLPSSERPSPVDSAVPSSPQCGDDDGDGDGDGDDGDGSGDDDGSEAQPVYA